MLTGPAHVHRAPLGYLHSHHVYGVNSHTDQQTRGPCLSNIYKQQQQGKGAHGHTGC